jgi:hypothetical protein
MLSIQCPSEGNIIIKSKISEIEYTHTARIAENYVCIIRLAILYRRKKKSGKVNLVPLPTTEKRNEPHTGVLAEAIDLAI